MDGKGAAIALAEERDRGEIRYASSRWRALTRYFDDGHLEIDNSAAERALRAVTVGLKNYLFAGSDAGGDRTAASYSLIGSAKLIGVDPELYLRTLLARVADHPVKQIAELRPWNLGHAPERPTQGGLTSPSASVHFN